MTKTSCWKTRALTLLATAILCFGQTSATHAVSKVDHFAEGDPNLAKMAVPLLKARSQVRAANGKVPANSIYKGLMPGAVRLGEIQCIVSVTELSDVLEQAIADAGLRIVGTHSYADLYAYTVRCSNPSQFDSLIPLSHVLAVTPEPPAMANAGLATSQADALIGAASARAQFMVDGNIDGGGLRVGVLSDSVGAMTGGTISNVTEGLLNDSTPQTTSDLPADIVVIDAGIYDATAGQIVGRDEGIGMMELIYDLAPGVEFSFASAFTGYFQFADNITSLRNPSGSPAHILVDDVINLAEPKYQDGPIALAAEAAIEAGVPFFSSAGNTADFAHEAAYLDSNGVPSADLPPTGMDFHDFGGGVTHMEINLATGEEVLAVLHWNQPYQFLAPGAGSAVDFDVYLVSDEVVPLDATRVLASSTLRQGTDDARFGDPYEILSYTSPSAATVYLVIDHFVGALAPTPNLSLKFFRGGPQVANQSLLGGKTIYGHTAAENVMSVAAMDYREIEAEGDLQPPTGELNVQPFSAKGGTLTFNFDETGAAQNSVREKPDITAPDGTDTTSFPPGGPDVEPNGFPNFFGTSAAAPHAAAVAALVMEAAELYNNPAKGLSTPGGLITPQQVHDILVGNATPLVMSQEDYAGAGLINALASVVEGASTDAPPPPPIAGCDDLLNPNLDVVLLSSPLTVDTTISDQKTYVVDLPEGSPVVSAGVTLTISNGANILIHPGTDTAKNFDVFGTLNITSLLPVSFNSCDPNVGWGAIRIFTDPGEGQPSLLTNVVLINAGSDTSRGGVTMDDGEGNPVEVVKAIEDPIANHCLRLSALAHEVLQIEFQNCGGVPIVADIPLIQSIGAVTGADLFEGNIPSQYRAIGIHDARGEPFAETTPSQSATTLSGHPDFDDTYLFLSSAHFNSSLTVDAGVNILVNDSRVIRCQRAASFEGTSGSPIAIGSASPTICWGRVELVGSGPFVQNVTEVEFDRSGAPAYAPLLEQVGPLRVVRGESARIAPGCSILIAGNNHTVADCRFTNWKELGIVQDVRVEPDFQGTLDFGSPLGGRPFFNGIGIFDLTLFRDEFPLVLPGDTLIDPPTSTFVYADDPLRVSPDFYFDRDVVVPRNFRLDAIGGPPGTSLVLAFSKKETATSREVSNFFVGKNEVLVSGALNAQGNLNNRVLFTSTDYATPIIDSDDETDFNETDFKGVGAPSGLGDLLSDYRAMHKESQKAEAASGSKGKTRKGFDPSTAFDWGGVFLLEESDDVETEISLCAIENGANGVVFLTSSGALRDTRISNCFGNAILCFERSFPLIERNRVFHNGQGGIASVAGSAPYIIGNDVSQNPDAAGVYCGGFSSPILTGNTITGNNIGVLIESGSAPNLGRVGTDPADSLQPDPEPDPGFATDNGMNNIFENQNSLGFVVNVVNNTPNRIYAENNNWGVFTYLEVDDTIIDDDEGGLLPGVIAGAGLVDFIPLRGAAIEPTATPTVEPTPRPTLTPTPVDPNATPTSTPILVDQPSPTPTSTPPPLPSDIFADMELSGTVRVVSDVTIHEGVTIMMQPGTRVLVEGDYQITALPSSRILAVGTESQRIFFISTSSTTWKGLRIEGTFPPNPVHQSNFDRCVFQRASVAGLAIHRSGPAVQRCLFRDCANGVSVTGGGVTNPRLRRNVFENNETSLRVQVGGPIDPNLDEAEVFNLGLGREVPDATQNVDPGWNVFVRSATSDDVDINVTGFFDNRTLLAEENLFLEANIDGTVSRIDDANDLFVSDRVRGASLSVTTAAINQNVVDTAKEVRTFVDDEVWAGKVVLPAKKVIEIAEDVNITVLPGTRVRFTSDTTTVVGRQPTLRVRGRLDASGSRSRPVVFESASGAPSEFDWGGLEFVATENENANPSRVRYAEIRHAAVGVTAYAGVRTRISDTLIENCGETGIIAADVVPAGLGGGIRVAKETLKTTSAALNKRGVVKGNAILVSRPQIDRVFVLGGARSEFGLHCINSEPTLRRSSIGVDPRSNDLPDRPFKRASVLVEGGRVADLGRSDEFGNNIIAGSGNPANGAYNIIHNSPRFMRATGNYWFETDVRAIKLNIFDFDENKTAGSVIVSPFLSSPPSSDSPGGDFDEDAFYLANDFILFLKGAMGSAVGDPEFVDFVDLDENLAIQYPDVFLLALQYTDRSTHPVRRLAPTPVPSPTPPILGGGDIQITLTWNTGVDLDLFVLDPNNELVWRNNPVSVSGGIYEGDNRGACAGHPYGGPENTYWGTGRGIRGAYFIQVDYADDCDVADTTDYSVRVRELGQPDITYNGTVTNVGDRVPDPPISLFFLGQTGAKDLSEPTEAIRTPGNIVPDDLPSKP